MREKILEALRNVADDADFEASEDLLEDGLIDSFQMVKLVSELEDAFSIDINGSDIIPDNFLNLKTIEEMVKRYTEA